MDENKQEIPETTETPQVPTDDVTNQSFNEVVANANALDAEAEETVETPEEKKEETPVVETPPPVETKPETPPAPVIDEEKLSETIVDKILKANQKENTPQEQSALELALEEVSLRAKAEGRELTYKEAMQVVKEVSKKEVKEEILAELQAEADAEEQKEKEEREATEARQQEINEQWNSYWDTQFAELEEDGRIPKGEAGKQVRIDLLTRMHEVAEEQQAKGLQPILNIKEIFAFHYTPKEDAMAEQKNAPVFNKEKSVANKPTPPTTEQLRNMDFRDALSVASEIDNS